MSAPKDPTSFNFPDRRTLEDADVGRVGEALLTLTREVWVLTDRLTVIEAVLAKRGMDIREEIEAFEPDEDLRSEMDARGKALVSAVLNTLAGLPAGGDRG